MGHVVVKLDLSTISKSLKDECYSIIPPKFRCCLDNKDPDNIENTRIIALAAFNREELAAIALVGLYDAMPLAELYTFNIKEHYFERQLAFDLLNKVEECAFQEGYIIINHFFRLIQPGSPIFTSTLKERQWSEPQLFMIRYFFEAYTFHPPWFDLAPPLPKDFEEFPWFNLKQNERAALKKEAKEGRYPSLVNPFYQESSMEPFTSLGLRKGEEIVGWIVNHKIAPDTLRYTSFFIKPEYKHKGIPIRLLMDSMKLQQKSPIKWSVFELSLNEFDKSWLRFALHRLAPYAFYSDEIYRTWKASSPAVFDVSSIGNW